MSKVNLSLILACYNEGPTFVQSVKKIVSSLNKTKYRWEIIFVEDKSGDNTGQVVKKLTSEIKNSSAIFHKRNEGRGKSVTDGIRAARGDTCGYLDVDLEVSAEYIPIFAREIENGSDMAIGKRFYEGVSSSIFRSTASKMYALIVKLLLDLPIVDTEAGYKFFRRSKIVPILSKTRDKKWFWDTEICARAYYANLRISQVPVIFVRRPQKRSTVRMIPDTWEYLVKILKFRREALKLKNS